MESRLTALQGTCIFFFLNHIPQSLNRQSPERCRCRNTASITGLSMRNGCCWDEIHHSHKATGLKYAIWRTYNTKCVLSGFYSKALHCDVSTFLGFYELYFHRADDSAAHRMWSVTVMLQSTAGLRRCHDRSPSRSSQLAICGSTCDPINIDHVPLELSVPCFI